MERIKIEKRSNYTVIDNTILRDKAISLKAKGLLCLIMSLPDNWDFSVQGLAEIVAESKHVLYGTINELIDAGYCKKETIRESGRFAGCEYTFYELPHAKKSDAEKSDAIFQPQINKDINKVKNKINTNNSLSDEKKFFEKKITPPPSCAAPPPSREEVLRYFEGKVPIQSDTPERFYNIMQACEWRYKGSQVSEWKLIADNWIKMERTTNVNKPINYSHGKTNHTKSSEEYRASRIAELWRLANT